MVIDIECKHVDLDKLSAFLGINLRSVIGINQDQNYVP